jgi:FMN phosphatase YigB (HAD superfamily)
MSAARQKTVFLFDVDNTLLDNDHVIADLSQHLDTHFDPDCRAAYFATFEQLRSETGYADYLGALQRYRLQRPTDMRLFSVSAFLLNYPFADRFYPNALKVIERCKQLAPTIILSDGDVVFQPHKVERSGLRTAVDHHVLIYIHKEEMLDDVSRRYPADHYVFVDDKPRLAAAIKQHWGPRVTTILPRQGHYALAQDAATFTPPPDITIEKIGDLMTMDLSRFVA